MPAPAGRRTASAKKTMTPRSVTGRAGVPALSTALARRRLSSRRSGDAISQRGKNRRLTVMLRRVSCTASAFATPGKSASRVRTATKPGITKMRAMISASTVVGTVTRLADDLLFRRRYRRRTRAARWLGGPDRPFGKCLVFAHSRHCSACMSCAGVSERIHAARIRASGGRPRGRPPHTSAATAYGRRRTARRRSPSARRRTGRAAPARWARGRSGSC